MLFLLKFFQIKINILKIYIWILYGLYNGFVGLSYNFQLLLLIV